MTPPIDPRRAGEWWEWECRDCEAVMRAGFLPAEEERKCLFCPREESGDVE